MRTTITLDDDVAEAAKALARSTGKTLGKVISDLARQSLRPRRSHPRRSRVPSFEVSDDDEIIPGDRTAKLLAEEGP
jgi:hypothetical protein